MRHETDKSHAVHLRGLSRFGVWQLSSHGRFIAWLAFLGSHPLPYPSKHLVRRYLDPKKQTIQTHSQEVLFGRLGSVDHP